MNLDRNIKITNDLSVALSIVTIPFVFVFASLPLYVKSMTIFLAVIYLVTVVLNKFCFYNLARFNIIFFSNFSLVFYGILLGSSSNVLNVFYPFFSLPFILFDYTEKVQIIFSTVITVSSIGYLKYIYSSAWMPYLFYIPNPFISLSIFLTSIVLSFVILFFYIKRTQSYENRLKEVHLAELSGIKKTIVALSHHVNQLLVPIVTNAYSINQKLSDDESKYHVNQITDNSHKISRLIKKLSRIKDVRDVSYANGVMMIDIEGSTYNDDYVDG